VQAGFLGPNRGGVAFSMEKLQVLEEEEERVGPNADFWERTQAYYEPRKDSTRKDSRWARGSSAESAGHMRDFHEVGDGRQTARKGCD